MAQVKLVRPTALSRCIYPTKTPSTAYAFNTLVQGKAAEDGSTPARFISATSSTERVLGVLQQDVVAADSDYASASRKKVLVDEVGEYEFAVGTGTADTSDPQGYIDLKDEDEVDVTASTVDLVFVTKFVSTTKVRGQITGWANQRPATN